jgi:predicted membrane protein
MVIQYVSIFIEVLISVLGLLIIFQKKKIYGWGIFLTFAIYVIYDLAKLNVFIIFDAYLYLLFFIASISALWAVFEIYRGGKKRK